MNTTTLQLYLLCNQILLILFPFSMVLLKSHAKNVAQKVSSTIIIIFSLVLQPAGGKVWFSLLFILKIAVTVKFKLS